MFSIWRAEDGEEKVAKFDRSRKPVCSRIMEYRELSLPIRHLDAGRYFIVPSTKKPNEYGKYYLNIYFSNPVNYDTKNFHDPERKPPIKPFILKDSLFKAKYLSTYSGEIKEYCFGGPI